MPNACEAIIAARENSNLLHIYSFIHSSNFIKLANRSFGLLNRFQIEIEIHVNVRANICVYFKCPSGERKRIAIHWPAAACSCRLVHSNNIRTFEIYCWPFSFVNSLRKLFLPHSFWLRSTIWSKQRQINTRVNIKWLTNYIITKPSINNAG